MPGQLRPMTRIATRLGAQVRVVRLIGSGGQGDVYEVVYNGERKALKWYPDAVAHNRAAFVKNLHDNIDKGCPSPAFLWPIDMIDFYDGGFGYVMDLKPDGFYEAIDLLFDKVTFPSYRRVVDACMRIVSAFRILHGVGYAYQDINLKNFFINPDTGEVLICDNDNVVPDNTDTGMRGTWGFMAPEIVHGGYPTERADRHSMAVLIFMLLFKVHPLEGIGTFQSVMTDSERVRIYGDEPLFVFDANDRSNELPAYLYAATIELWEQMPDYLRSLFYQVFSQDALHGRAGRPEDVEWILALTRLRSELYPCPCGGSELIISQGQSATCDICGRATAPQLMIDLGPQAGYAVPALHDARIYACQTRVVSPKHALDPEGWVLRMVDDHTVLGLRNMTKRPWIATNRKSVSQQVGPGGVVVLEEGLSITGPHHFGLTCRRVDERSV